MNRTVLLDGSTGAMLAQMGMPSGVCVEKWACEHPECVVRLQNAYLDAGSEVLYTPTFGANEVTLSRHSLGDETEALNAALARLTRETAAGRAKVLGDMSPTGEMLFPMGSMTEKRLIQVYARQAKALEPYVDGFICETFMSLAELRCAFFGVRSVSDKPVLTTLTLNANARTMCGDALVPSLITMQSLGVAAFGVNCVSQPESLLSAIGEALRYAKIPFIFKPNAGMPEIIDGKAHYSMTPEVFSGICAKARALGVSVFGGCCGTSPSFIAALAMLRDIDAPETGEKDVSGIAATSRQIFTSVPEPEDIVCDEDMASVIESDTAYRIFVPDEESAEFIAESAMLLSYPPVFTGSEKALEAAVRAYNGRAFVQSDAAPLGAVSVQER